MTKEELALKVGFQKHDVPLEFYWAPGHLGSVSSHWMTPDGEDIPYLPDFNSLDMLDRYCFQDDWLIAFMTSNGRKCCLITDKSETKLGEGTGETYSIACRLACENALEGR